MDGVGGPLIVTNTVVIPGDELRWRFSRSSGPGGQGVNTADSRVELSWDVASSRVLDDVLRERAVERLANRLADGVLTVTASEHRAQLRNRDMARTRLSALIRAAIAAPAPQRRGTRPSRAAQRRRLEEKKRRADVKRMRRSPAD